MSISWCLYKIAKSNYWLRRVCLSVCLSVCLPACLPARLSACNDKAANGRIFMEFDIKLFF
jgi:hypothetical protein